MNFSRFREPTARDDMQACVWCYTLVHYETLNRQGYCEDCCVLPEDDEKEEDEKD